MEDDACTSRPSTTTDNTLIVIKSTLLDKERRMIMRDTIH